MPRGVGGVVGYEAGGVRAGITGRLTGGAAIATCLESNYWLTHLDLSWNKARRRLNFVCLFGLVVVVVLL